MRHLAILAAVVAALLIGLISARAGTETASYAPPVNTDLFYGDGSSGSGHMDGSTVTFGLTPTGGNTYTLTGNIYATDLTIDSGISLVAHHYWIEVSGTLTLNGTIDGNGGDANGVTGGAATSANNYVAVAAGTAGSTGTGSGSGGSGATTGGIFGGGGGGGHGTGGSTGGQGSAGSPNQFVLYEIKNGRFLSSTMQSGASTLPTTGSYGLPGTPGIAHGDGTNPGASGGGAGYLVYVRAQAISMGASGLIRANGGAGGSAAALTGSNLGGGGGGAGGAVVLYYTTATGTALVSGTNVTATGGGGGAPKGSGSAGGNGSDGNVFIIKRQ